MAAQEKDLWSSECVYTDGRQGMERSEEDAMSLLSYFQRSGIGAYLIVFRKDDSRVHSCQRSAKQFMVVAGFFMFLGRTVISFRHGNCFRGKTMLGNSPPPPPPPIPIKIYAVWGCSCLFLQLLPREVKIAAFSFKILAQEIYTVEG